MGDVDPSDREKPWPLLLLVAHSCFGLYFGYDTLSALTSPLHVSFGFSMSEIGTLISTYALATLCLVFFGGVLYEYFGARKMLIMTTVTNTLGMFIIANSSTFPFMMLGMVLFGGGCCYLYFVVITLMGGWFKGPKKDLKMNIAIGALHCWLRLGSFSSYNVLPNVEKRFGLRMALYTSFFVCLTSLISAVAFVLFDVHLSKKQQNLEQTVEPPPKKIDQDERFFPSLRRSLMFYFKCYASLPLPFWFISAIAMGFVASLFTFTSFGIQILTKSRKMEYEEAASMVSLLPVSNGLTTALVSTAIGFVGHRGWFGISAALCTTSMFVLFLVTDLTPIVTFMSLGVIQSLMDAVIFPSIAIVVPKDKLSYSISLTIFMYNVMLFGMAQVSGRLAENSQYDGMMISYIALSCLSILGAVSFRITEMKRFVAQGEGKQQTSNIGDRQEEEKRLLALSPTMDTEMSPII